MLLLFYNSLEKFKILIKFRENYLQFSGHFVVFQNLWYWKLNRPEYNLVIFVVNSHMPRIVYELFSQRYYSKVSPFNVWSQCSVKEKEQLLCPSFALVFRIPFIRLTLRCEFSPSLPIPLPDSLLKVCYNMCDSGVTLVKTLLCHSIQKSCPFLMLYELMEIYWNLLKRFEKKNMLNVFFRYIT